MDFKKLRDKMVFEQIYKRGIDNQDILDAFIDVPRHLFLPEDKRGVAYEDYPVSIGEGQTISQPYMVALMLKLLEVAPGMKVLEIGTGSGYQAAILSALGVNVYSIEIIESLAQRAKKTISELNYAVNIKVGDGALGWEEEAPFDRIIVSAACSDVVSEWKKQLRPGGLIVLPLGGFLHQYLVVVAKSDEYTFTQKEFCQCVFVPLTGEHGYKD